MQKLDPHSMSSCRQEVNCKKGNSRVQDHFLEDLPWLFAPILAVFHTSFHTVIWLNLLQKPCGTPHFLARQLCETTGCRQGRAVLLAIGFGRGVCRAEGIREETSSSFSL